MVNDEALTFELGHTCMNHFALLDCREGRVPNDGALRRLAGQLCAGAMADDLLVLQDSTQADVHLRIFGGDQREADFCGNGTIYSVAKIGRELQRDHVTIETAAGIKAARKLDGTWQVEIGAISSLGRQLAGISMPQNWPVYGLMRAGEPHLVMFCPPEIDGFHVHRHDFEDFCRPLRDITDIDGGINITMVFQIGFRSLLIRTYERGVSRHTFSCGTGSAAAIAAVFGTPDNGTTFNVCAPGGAHRVSYEHGLWRIAASTQLIGSGQLDGTQIRLPLEGLQPYQSRP